MKIYNIAPTIMFMIAMLTMSLYSFSASAKTTKTETATCAAGCFWCAQADFDKVTGVIKTTVGYTGGMLENPTYEQYLSDNILTYRKKTII